MIKIAIVEDNKDDQQKLIKRINDYELKRNVLFTKKTFDNGIQFLENDLINYEIVFLDIEMPYMDGITLGSKIKQINPSAIIIIVSNSNQYAIKGYSINAIGYITKPIHGYSFDNIFDKALEKIKLSNASFILLTTDDITCKVSLMDIMYIEVFDHYLYFNLFNKVIKVRDSLSKFENLLKDKNFYKPIRSTLINLYYVEEIRGNNIVLSNQKEFPIARGKKAEFEKLYTKYIGDNF